jgi:hypothetical protein
VQEDRLSLAGFLRTFTNLRQVELVGWLRGPGVKYTSWTTNVNELISHLASPTPLRLATTPLFPTIPSIVLALASLVQPPTLVLEWEASDDRRGSIRCLWDRLQQEYTAEVLKQM